MKKIPHLCVAKRKTNIMSKVVQKSVQTREKALQLKNKKMRANTSLHLNVSKHQYLPIGGLLFFAVWIALSYQSNQLFLNEIMICGFVVNALLFMRAFDQATDQKSPND